MKRKILLVTMLALLCVSAAGRKKVVKTELWPDGTPMTAWFSDTSRVDLSELKQYVVTQHGVDAFSSQIQTEALQAVIDKAAREGGGVIVIPLLDHSPLPL
jgi:polygalacturonase